MLRHMIRFCFMIGIELPYCFNLRELIKIFSRKQCNQVNLVVTDIPVTMFICKKAPTITLKLTDEVATGSQVEEPLRQKHTSSAPD